MRELKIYERDEFAASLVELWEGDPAGLARQVLKINEWIKAGMRVAEFRNAELSPRSWSDRRYRGYVEEDGEIPNLIGDSQGTSRMYALEAVYLLGLMSPENTLDLPTMLGELKMPRPAVAHICTDADESGNGRQGWAVYVDQKLIEFVLDDDQHEDRLKELGADKEWATGTIGVSLEVWNELTNEDTWPAQNPHKFSSHRAERLYGDAMSSFDDGSVGDGDWGCYWLFGEELTILSEDSRGHVSATVYENSAQLDGEWEKITGAWDAYFDEDEESE